MTKLSLALLGASMLTAVPAFAADIYGGSTKDGPAGVVAAGTDSSIAWGGFYVAVQGGYGNANHNLTVNEYFKDFCTGYDPSSPGYDGFDDPYRSVTLDNYNAAWDKLNRNGPEWFKAAGVRSDCATQAGHVNSPDIRDDFNIPTATTVVPNTSPGQSREWANIDGLNSHGFIGGGRLGYDFARGRFLAGVFGEYNFSGMETTANIAGVGAFGIEKEDEWSIGARVGYIVAPRTLAYVLAAYTQTEYSVTGLDNPIIAGTFDKRSGGATFDGISVGGGIEFALTQNVFFGLEYTHTFYGEEKLIDLYSTASNVGISVDDDLDEDKVMGTLKIKFNGFGG